MRRVLAQCLVAVLLVSGSLTSCGTKTKMVGVWTEPEFQKKSMSKVLVLGMSDKEGIRRAFEAHVKQGFIDKGIEAIAASDVLPTHKELDKDTFDTYFKDKNIDGIIVSRMTSANVETQYTPGNAYALPYSYYGNFFNYYGANVGVVYSPGYLSTEQIVKLETNLYETKEAKIVWSGISETVDPNNPLDAIESFSKALIETMIKEDFFIRRK